MTNKPKTFRKTLSIDWSLRQKIGQIADDQDRSITYVCNKLIEMGLARPELLDMDKGRRGGPKFNVNISMDEPAKKAMEEFARDHERSLSFVCNRALEAGLARMEISSIKGKFPEEKDDG